MQKKIRAKGLHEEMVFSCAKVDNYLLYFDATNEIMAGTIKELWFYRQALRVFAAWYENRLYTKALRCGSDYEDKRGELLFVEGLDELILVNVPPANRIHEVTAAKASEVLPYDSSAVENKLPKDMVITYLQRVKLSISLLLVA